MDEFLKVMKALSAPNRVKIVKILQHAQSLCVCEIQALLGMSGSSVSTHLKILHEAGFIDRYKKDLWVHYRLSEDSGSPYAAAGHAHEHETMVGHQRRGDGPGREDTRARPL